MPISLKPVSEQVIVITGASSGIGLATAYRLAKSGARLVLAARNEEALAAIEAEIRADGGEAVYVAADVGRREDVQKIADKAIETFGGFDTWINDAGIGIAGRLDEVSDEDSRRLFDTNFWGLVYGSLIAVEHLKGKGGSLINLGSEVSDVSMPLQGMYSASKHAIKAFTETLRMELEEEKAPVSVTLIKPAAIGTPFFEHSRNYTGHQLKAPPPVYKVEDAARAIAYAAGHPIRDLYVGGQGKIMGPLVMAVPRLFDKIAEKMMFKAELAPEPANLNDPNNLHQAGEDGKTVGRNVGHPMPSLYTRAKVHPVLTRTAVIVIGLAATVILKRDDVKDYLGEIKKKVS